MLHTIFAALVLAVTMLAVAGCGSSKSETSSSAAATSTTGTAGTTTGSTGANVTSVPAVTVQVASGKPLPRARWVAQSNAICAHLSNEIETLSVKKAAELTRVLPQEAALVRTEIAQLVKLVPPTSKASEWQEFLIASLQWAEGSDKLAGEGKFGDAITKTPLAQAIIAIRARMAAIARHSGVKLCAFQ